MGSNIFDILSPMIVEKRLYVTPLAKDYSKVVEDLQLLEPENSTCETLLSENKNLVPLSQHVVTAAVETNKTMLACSLCDSFQCLDRDTFQLHTNEIHLKEIKSWLVGVLHNSGDVDRKQKYITHETQISETFNEKVTKKTSETSKSTKRNFEDFCKWDNCPCKGE